MASTSNRYLYIGITSNILQRVHDHKVHRYKGFTEQHDVTKLVYYEIFYYVNNAINREKQLKRWNRSWKEQLINNINPQWLDLTNEL
jgi:putative endonuclease